MFPNQKIVEGAALVATIDPQTVANSELFTDVIDFSKIPQVMASLYLGNMAAETIDFRFYSCDSDGSNAALVSGKAITQLAAHATNNDNVQHEINVRAGDLLASGKQYGKFGLVTGGATGGPACVSVYATLRQGQATDSDLTSVGQIVS